MPPFLLLPPLVLGSLLPPSTVVMDPLSAASSNPSWSKPSEASAGARRASSTSPSFRDPKIYGMPGLGLVSPPAESSSQATDITMNIGGDGTPTKREKPVSFLRVRIGGLERNRKDLLIRFDASVSPCLVQAFLRYGTTS